MDQSTARLKDVTNVDGLIKYIPGVEELFGQGFFYVKTGQGGQLKKVGGYYTVYVSLDNHNKKQLASWGDRASRADRAGASRLTFRAKGNKTDKDYIEIPFGEILKPATKANMGDVSEGIFACALACRFTWKRKGGMVTSDDVYTMIKSLDGTRMGSATYPHVKADKKNGFILREKKKGLEACKIIQTPNKGISLKDDMRLYVGLAKANMNFLIKAGNDKAGGSNRKAIKSYVDSAVAYANHDKVKRWAVLVYENGKHDFIDIEAIGLAGQTQKVEGSGLQSKIDVQVSITDWQGNPIKIKGKGVDLKISLKAGSVTQFGQKGGTNFQKEGNKPGYVDFFKMLFDIDVKSKKRRYNSLKYSSNPNGDERISDATQFLYKFVGTSLDAKLNGDFKTRKKIYEKLADGILHYATSHEKHVHLVQLNAANARIYEFNNLPGVLAATYSSNAKSKNRMSVDYETYGDFNLPRIKIKDSNTNEVFLTIRVKTEKVDGEQYYRNYVEKGPLMGDLISSLA